MKFVWYLPSQAEKLIYISLFCGDEGSFCPLLLNMHKIFLSSRLCLLVYFHFSKMDSLKNSEDCPLSTYLLNIKNKQSIDKDQSKRYQ